MDQSNISIFSTTVRLETSRMEDITSSDLGILKFNTTTNETEQYDTQCPDFDNFDYNEYLLQVFLSSNYSRISLSDFFLIQTFYFVMYGIILHVACIGGMIGNILSFIVLNRREMKSSTSTYLAALMICDCVVLLCGYCNEVLGTGLHVSYRYIHYVSPYVSVYVAALGQLCRDSGVLLTIAVTVERYIYVCHTFKASTMCTIKRAKITSCILILCTVLYHIPTFLYQHVIQIYVAPCDITYHVANLSGIIPHEFYTVQKLYLHPVLFYVIPIVASSVLTIILIREVHKTNVFRQQMSQNQSMDVNVTVVLISVVIVFLICSTPTMVYLILMTAGGIEVLFSLEGTLAWHTAAVLIYSNSAINFILFCTFGEKFRKTFKKTFLRQGPCKRLGKVWQKRYSRYSRYSSVSGAHTQTDSML